MPRQERTLELERGQRAEIIKRHWGAMDWTRNHTLLPKTLATEYEPVPEFELSSLPLTKTGVLPASNIGEHRQQVTAILHSLRARTRVDVHEIEKALHEAIDGRRARQWVGIRVYIVIDLYFSTF